MAIIDGDGNDNLLEGGDDRDTLTGFDGNDSLYGGLEIDHLYGGAGNDVLDGYDGSDRIYGGAGNDRLFGGYGNDRLYGGNGDDSFDTGHGATTVRGGAGDDHAAVYSFGGPTHADFDMGSGNDFVFLSSPTEGRVLGGTGEDSLSMFIYDLTGDNALVLTPQLATIGDKVLVLDGFEAFEITATAGNDDITTGDGNDRIIVLRGDDRVFAGAGDDLVAFQPGGQVTLDGGIGHDTLIFGINGGATPAAVDLSGGVYDDGMGSQITGFENFVAGGAYGDDRVTLSGGDDGFYGYFGNDSAEGGLGQDSLAGEVGNDSLFGGAGRDVLDGGRHSDLLDGGTDSDWLRGGSGADVMFGGDGRDRLIGSNEGDSMTGGAGADSFVFVWRDGTVDTVTDWEAGLDRLLIRQSVVDGAIATGSGVTLSLGAAVTAGPEFIVTTTAGGDTLLSFDIDGTGTAAARDVALFTGAVTLVASDIHIL